MEKPPVNIPMFLDESGHLRSYIESKGLDIVHSFLINYYYYYIVVSGLIPIMSNQGNQYPIFGTSIHSQLKRKSREQTLTQNHIYICLESKKPETKSAIHKPLKKEKKQKFLPSERKLERRLEELCSNGENWNYYYMSAAISPVLCCPEMKTIKETTDQSHVCNMKINLERIF